MSKRFIRCLVGVLILVMLGNVAACTSTPATPEATTAAPTKTEATTTAAATTASPEETSASLEPITLTWLGGVLSKDITTGIPDNPVFKEITKRTGVTIDFTPTLGVTNLDERIAVLTAGDDLPDLVTSTEHFIVNSVLGAKAAIPLDELLKTHGKNILATAEKMITVSKLTSTDETNRLYFLSYGAGDNGKSNITANDNNWSVRWDLYKKLGMPKINGYDDLLKLGEDMLALEPTNKEGKPNYPLGLFLAESWGYWLCAKPAVNYSGVKNSHPTAGMDAATDAVVPYLQDPNCAFWEETKFFNKAAQKNLLDPESLTLNFNSFMEKAKTGRYLMTYAMWALGGVEEQFIASGQKDKGYAPIPIFEIKPNSFFSETSESGLNWCLFVSANCKTPERAVDFLDFLYTPDGIALTTYGIEGEHWIAKNGYVERPKEIQDQIKGDPDYYKKIGFGMINNLLSPYSIQGPGGLYLYENTKVRMEKASDALKDYCTVNNVEYPAQVFQKGNLWNYWNSAFLNVALEANSDLANKEAAINAYLPTAVTQAIFAKSDAEFEAKKAEIIKALIDMGGNELLTYYTDKYSEIKKKIASMQ